MVFITTQSPAEGIKAFASQIGGLLCKDKKVLWLVPGGTNIPISVEVMKIVRKQVSEKLMNNLTVTLTDERFGPVGHKDSNWEQLMLAGFDFSGIQTLPVLKNLSLEETVNEFSKNIERAFSLPISPISKTDSLPVGEVIPLENSSTSEIINGNDIVIGQFGIGPDGHIAGILPNSSAVKSLNTTFSYTAPPFTRITLTPKALLKISIAYAFVFGESKREAISNLQIKNLSIEEQPAQILKKLKEAYLYSYTH
ncbi:MAG: 6-phosphogluconolactonase [Candidatus Paceibacterota bacterium]|jgi:6-phosphogluconolactonase/glucosamine-6-phosphate isomerase/deaminase